MYIDRQPSATSPTFQLDFIPGRFAVVLYDADRIVQVDSEFLPWKDARRRARELNYRHTCNGDKWAAAIPQPVVRDTFGGAPVEAGELVGA